VETLQSKLTTVKDSNLTTGYTATILIAKSTRYNFTQILCFNFIDFLASVTVYLVPVYLIVLGVYRHFPLFSTMQIIMPVS
jgi:hypothetical protein